MKPEVAMIEQNEESQKPEIDIKRLLAEIEQGTLVIRAVSSKILEVSRPGIESQIRVAEPIYDSSDFIARQEGTRSILWVH